MRLLILTPIYFPEMGALANRLSPIVRQFTHAGHEVLVATGMPNYPAGVVFPEYRRKLFVRERVDGATVLRTPYYVTPRNRSKSTQLLSYISFLPAVLNSALAAGNVDAVFVTSPPIFPIVVGVTIAKLRGAKLIFDVRDLWPDEIVACGAAREGSAAVRLISSLEHLAYTHSDMVCCTTHAFVDTVTSRGANPAKIVYVPNGADLSTFRPMEPDPKLSDQLPLAGRFTVMYSGLLGIKHGLETIVDAAAKLRDVPEIAFVFVGAGPTAESLEKHVTELGLHNVFFAGDRCPSDVPKALAAADVCVTSLKPEPYLEKIVPAKIYEYMACGKPVVAGVSGEGARIIQESQSGLVTPPGDSQAMADAILELYNNPDERSALASHGRPYVENNFSREKSAVELQTVIEGLVDHPVRRSPRLATKPRDRFRVALSRDLSSTRGRKLTG